MNDFIAMGLPIVVFSCSLPHNIFAFLLERIIPDKMPVYTEIFTFANTTLTEGEDKPTLRLKYVLPWIASPDLSAFGSSAIYFLFLARLFAVLGTLTLVFTALYFIVFVYT